jgi:hypothetical protein
MGSSPLVIGASNESTTTNTHFIKFDENTVLESLTDQTYHVAVNMIRSYNKIHCQGLPHTLPEHVCKVQDSSSEEVLAKLKSAGKLAELLENDFPDWEEVDQAVQEHVKLLHKLDLTP